MTRGARFDRSSSLRLCSRNGPPLPVIQTPGLNPMITKSVLNLRWFRLLSSRLGGKQPQTLAPDLRPALWELETRSSPGNVFNVLFTSLSLGYLLSDSAVGQATNTSSLAIVPETDTTETGLELSGDPKEGSAG